jgi:hypothetical protein
MKYLVIEEEKPIILKSRKDVIKTILYIKYLLKGLKPFDNDLDILSELFEFGCYSGKEDQTKFFDILLKKELRNSVASVRNKISELTNLGVLYRPHKNAISFTKDFLPTLESIPEKIGFISKITHAS